MNLDKLDYEQLVIDWDQVKVVDSQTEVLKTTLISLINLRIVKSPQMKTAVFNDIARVWSEQKPMFNENNKYYEIEKHVDKILKEL